MKPKAVVAIGGLPTTGKTTLGKALAVKLGIHYVDIDAGPVQCGPPQEQNPYRSEESKLREQARMRVAYSVLWSAVEANLREGFSIIISATFSRHGAQDTLQDILLRNGATLKFILCRYNDTEKEIERRINDRLHWGAVGGCRSVSHYLSDKERYAGIKLPHIVVDMDGGEEGVSRAVVRALAYINEE